jgi:hypothetical protein
MDFFGLLGDLGDAIDSQLGAVVSWATAGFAALFGDISGVWGVLTSFISWVWGAVSAIVNFLRAMWDWLYNTILAKIIAAIHTIHEYLKNLFGPLIRWIQLERALLYRLWYTYVRPIMNFIQDLRRFLVIFRLLGFKWAKQLDQYLVDVENKINAAFLGAWKNLNILADWINWITDPFGLWSSNVWFGALGQSINAIWNMIWGLPQVGLSGAGITTFSTPQNYFDAGAVQARILLYAQGGSLPEDTIILDALHTDAATMGYGPPVF